MDPPCHLNDELALIYVFLRRPVVFDALNHRLKETVHAGEFKTVD